MTRLELKDGRHYIEITDRQTMGDKEDAHTYANDGLATDGTTYKLSPTKFRTASVATRLVGWNLEEETFHRKDGKTIVEMKAIAWDRASAFKQRIAILRRLDAVIVEELYDLIDAFDDRQAVAAAYEAGGQEKNAPTSDAPGSTAVSPSVK